jgi:hypothetical protein
VEDVKEARDLLALLAEPDRLKALAAVVLGAATLAEVAERAGLPPRTAAKALNRLAAGGLLDGDAGKGYRVRSETLRVAARRPASSNPAGDDPALGDGPEAEVLRRFVRGGRLLSIPVARAKRLLVLDHLAGLFEPGRRYLESEVNEALRAYHPDYATLRRYLVDEGFLDRADETEASGSRSVKLYWRSGGTIDVGRSSGA